MVSQDPGFCKCRVQALNILTADSQNLNFSENILFFNNLGAFFGECGDFGGSVGVVVAELLSIVSALEGPSPDCQVGKLLQMFLWPAQNTTEVQSYQN